MTKKVLRKVEKVIDGDSVIVSSPVMGSRHIRLAGKNSPEKGERGFQTAKSNLRRQVGGKKIWVEPVGKSYGRTVARIRKVRRDKK